MKKNRLLIAFIISSVASINANPIVTTYFSELMFDSTGWKLELHCSHPQGDISLDGWYLISSTDSARLKPGMKLSDTTYLIISKNDLIGNFNIKPDGDTIYLYSPENFWTDFISFGPGSLNPVPKLNESICLYRYQEFYLDCSPTIGFANDSLDATGRVRGHVVDAADKPAKNLKITYDDDMTHTKVIYTDTSGNFIIPSALAKQTSFYMSNGVLYTLADLFILPKKVHELNIKLNWIITSVKDGEVTELDFNLHQNYPNPFNPSTILNFTIKNEGMVTLKVFDALGSEVETILNDFMTAGKHEIQFDASQLASGTYYYQLKSNGKIATKKMILER